MVPNSQNHKTNQSFRLRPFLCKLQLWKIVMHDWFREINKGGGLLAKYLLAVQPLRKRCLIFRSIVNFISSSNCNPGSDGLYSKRKFYGFARKRQKQKCGASFFRIRKAVD